MFWSRPTLNTGKWLSPIIYKIKYLSCFKVQRSNFLLLISLSKNGCVEFRKYCFWVILIILIFFTRTRYFCLIINFNHAHLNFSVSNFLLLKVIPTRGHIYSDRIQRIVTFWQFLTIFFKMGIFKPVCIQGFFIESNVQIITNTFRICSFMFPVTNNTNILVYCGINWIKNVWDQVTGGINFLDFSCLFWNKVWVCKLFNVTFDFLSSMTGISSLFMSFNNGQTILTFFINKKTWIVI